jgi:hypothetical protein
MCCESTQSRYEVLETRELASVHSWRIGRSYLIRVASGRGSILFLAPQKIANNLLKDLEQFPHYIANLEKRGDERTIKELQLFAEEEVTKARTPGTFTNVVKAAVVATILLGSLFGARAASSALDSHNEVRADELQWEAAKAHPIAPEFRMYLSSLPRGRHSEQATRELSQLYVSAAEQYRKNAKIEEDKGRAAVLALLERARSTGKYKVFVGFQRALKFPEHLVDDLKQEHSVKRIEPPHVYFSDERNRYRESMVFHTIQASFDSALGGGLLVFETEKSDPSEPELQVVYDVGPTGGLYYPTDQKAVPDADRDWIAGVHFQWNVKLRIDSAKQDDLAFQVVSDPAEEFSSDDNGLPITPEQRYNGMARSAFEDLGRQLFARLSIVKVDAKQEAEQKTSK